MATRPSPTKRRGFAWDQANSRLDVMVDSTVAARFNDSGSYLTIPAGGLTVTAGGLTVTAGNLVATAGDIRATAGNYRGGPVNSFATTEPTQAIVLEAGTAPAGAITTSSGLFASTTVMRKIIADGTISNVET